MSQQLPIILIIDDNSEDREIYKRYLRQDSKYNYEIWEEESGEKGLALCHQIQPDLMLIDFYLPDINGLEFLQALKVQKNEHILPVAILTGQGNELVAVQVMKSGAQDYLVKGKINAETFRLAVHSILENTTLRRQLAKMERRFRTSLDNMLDCFGIYTSVRDDRGQIVDFQAEFVNASACEIKCLKTKDNRGGIPTCPMPANGETKLFEEYCQVVETGIPLSREVLIYDDDRDRQRLAKAFDIRVTKLDDGLVATWRDITDRKQNEEILRQQLLIQKIADTTPGLVYVYDLIEKKNIYVNKQVVEFLGYTTEQIDAMGSELFAHLVHPEDRAILANNKQKLSSAVNGEVIESEYRIKHLNGEWRWYYSREIVFSRTTKGLPHQILGTAMDITERKRLEEERARILALEQAAREQAEAANRSKDEFLGVLSHELRSPLTVILAWVNLLQIRQFDSQTIGQGLAKIEHHAELLAHLIEDLLDISRLVHGKLHLDFSPVKLQLAIEAAIEIVSSSSEAKNIEIISHLDPSVGLVSGDFNRLQQVVWNLLSNAVKFTPQGGQIEISLSAIDREVTETPASGEAGEISSNSQPAIPAYAQIQVSDTGKGINPEFLPYVFDRFWQADSTTKRCYEGLGIGLALVKHLVEMHGGTIEVTSPGEGQGTTFTVQLPLQRESGNLGEELVALEPNSPTNRIAGEEGEQGSSIVSLLKARNSSKRKTSLAPSS